MKIHNGPTWAKDLIAENKAWPTLSFMAFVYIESYIVLSKAWARLLGFWPQNILKADGDCIKEQNPAMIIWGIFTIPLYCYASVKNLAEI